MVTATLSPEPGAAATRSFESLSRTPLNVLIVDDDRPFRASCRDALLSFGCQAMLTDSAERAFSILDADHIDLVLMGSTESHGARVRLLTESSATSELNKLFV